MPNKRIALIGCAEGPWVCIAQVRRPALRVTGMLEGKVDGVLLYKDKIPGSVYMGGNGELVLTDNPQWIQLKASHPCKSLICEIVTQAA